jgi:H+/Cl- antiporter ClcA/CBS domain-containing protein
MPSTDDRAGDRLSDFTRDRRIALVSLLAVVAGVLSAGIAWALLRLIALFTNLAYHQRLSTVAAEPGGVPWWALLLIPSIGGLVIGLAARYGTDRIRGHGIPEAIEAILFGRSRMSLQVAVLKPLTSAIAIGTGGPFGAEGPIIMTGGASGSLFAQLFHLAGHERRTLLVSGAVAGMCAVFGTPLAAVLLAVELLLFEWRPRSFIPVAVAVATASIVRVPLLGNGPLFPVPPHPPVAAAVMIGALVLGLACGAASGLLTMLVYAFEDLFQRLPFHWMWWPALGGLAVGVGGMIEPRALGVGYGNIHQLLHGGLPHPVTLLLVKALIWSIALGSGTSGGVLAPLLMMGGALGAVATPWLPGGDAGLWAAIGMAALMGGTMRSPLTAIAFAIELTHDLNLLPALLVGCLAAHGFTVLVLRRSILTEKVARRGRHVAREYAVDPLLLLRVSDVMDRGVQTVRLETPLVELADRLHRHDPETARRGALVLVDRHDAPVGIVTRGDIMRALEGAMPETPVVDVGNDDLIVAHPDETVHDAAARMLRHGVGRLAVVSREKPGVLVGYLGRAEVLKARARSLEDEQPEPGWLARAWSDKEL